MLRFETVATPFTAATLVVPARVPPPGLVPIAMVTVPVKPATVFPAPSCAATCTGGEIGLPAVVVLGWTTNASRVAAGEVVTLRVISPSVSVPERVYAVTGTLIAKASVPAPGLPLSQAWVVKVTNDPSSTRPVPPNVTQVAEVWVND